MGAKENRRAIETYYQAISEGDFGLLATLHTDDVVFNLVGRTPVSGRYVGKDVCFGELVSQQVLGTLVPDQFRFGKKWRIMAADDQCVVGIMQGGGPAKTGVNYEQTYCQVFTMRDGKISELHEFFDTVMVEAALFGNALQNPEKKPENAFQF